MWLHHFLREWFEYGVVWGVKTVLFVIKIKKRESIQEYPVFKLWINNKKMASNSVFNKLKKKELTDDERAEMKEKFADVSITNVWIGIFDFYAK